MSQTLVTDALTNRQKVKDAMSLTDSSLDTLIDEFINGVTGFIKSYTGGRQFLNQVFTEVFDSYRGRKKIFLRQIPVTVVTSVSFRSGLVSAPTWVPLDVNSYLTYKESGYVQFYGPLPEVPQGIQVVFNAGYLIDFTNEFDSTKHTLPEDITLVATELVVKYINTIKAAGLLTEQTEGQSVTFSYKARELDDDHRTILNSYVVNRIAR